MCVFPCTSARRPAVAPMPRPSHRQSPRGAAERQKKSKSGGTVHGADSTGIRRRLMEPDRPARRGAAAPRRDAADARTGPRPRIVSDLRPSAFSNTPTGVNPDRWCSAIDAGFGRLRRPRRSDSHVLARRSTRRGAEHSARPQPRPTGVRAAADAGFDGGARTPLSAASGWWSRIRAAAARCRRRRDQAMSSAAAVIVEPGAARSSGLERTQIEGDGGVDDVVVTARCR